MLRSQKKTFIIVLVLFPEAEMEAGIIILVFFKRHLKLCFQEKLVRKQGKQDRAGKEAKQR